MSSNNLLETRIAIKVSPNASATKIVGWQEDVLRIRVHSSPVDGKANKELLNYLSKCSGLSKNKVQLISGEISRQKWIAFIGIERTELLKRIAATISTQST